MDKKLEIKRLLVYLAFAFGLTWTIFFTAIFTGFKWDGSNMEMEQFIGLSMLMPFAAHILTRMITKEGFALTGWDSVMLGISFKDKKWRYYLFALIAPFIYIEISNVIVIAIVPEAFGIKVLEELGYGKGLAFISPVMVIVSSTIASFAALGEEGGWRGYMMPKLMKLMSVPKAIIVGGIIWGMWHAPLTCIGHNFGTDYPGFPYVGILIMCLDCILMGVLLTYVTMKTQSVWPAAIMHAVNNGRPSILQFFIDSEIVDQKLNLNLAYFLLMMVPTLIVVIAVILIEVRSKKKGQNN